MIDLPAGSSITYTVTSRVATDANTTLTNTVVVTPPVTVSDPTPDNNEDTDVDEPGTGAKQLTGTNQTFTFDPNVAVGEILTYQVTFDVAAAIDGDPILINGLTLVDTLDRGLAFVDCIGITTSTNSTGGDLHPVNGSFQAICANPSVETEPTGSLNPADPGRKVTWDFGSIENTGEASETLTVEYRVVVLDAQEVVRGVSLNNSAEWAWEGGDIQAVAEEVTVVEPTLTVAKSADASVLISGSIVTYSLAIGYAPVSNTNAYDVVLQDVIPAGLTYVPGSLVIFSGYSDAGTQIINSGAPTMIVRWPDFPAGSQAVVQYQVTVGTIGRGVNITNTANVSWTSLPGDYGDPQSGHNPLSIERYYDPNSSVDVYGVSASLSIPTPPVPETGYAPGMITPIAEQTIEKSYTTLSDMRLEIPALNLNMPIAGIPFDGTNWDLSWLNGQAGYLEGTAFPTHAGNSVITAHVYLPNGRPGPFIDLNKLRFGDQIIIHAFGQKYTYEVRSWSEVTPDDSSIFRHEKYPVITLVTCQDYDVLMNSYSTRYIVRAVQVKVE